MLAGLTSGLPAGQKTIRSRAVRDSHSCRQRPEDDRVWEAHIAKSLLFDHIYSAHPAPSTWKHLTPLPVRPSRMQDGSVIIPVFVPVCIPRRRVIWGLSLTFPSKVIDSRISSQLSLLGLARASQQTCNRPDHNPSYKRACSTVGRAFEDCWTTKHHCYVEEEACVFIHLYARRQTLRVVIKQTTWPDHEWKIVQMIGTLAVFDHL